MARAQLSAVLERARDLGFLGPGPVAGQLRHALGFAEVVGAPPAGRVVDLGSGGGVPGLVLAVEWPEADMALVDANQRRVVFLRRAVADLDLRRVEVVHRRAEELGHDGAWRDRATLVVARSFGPPGVLAECAAPLLQRGGCLVVSEPPAPGGDVGSPRWPEAGVRQLGLRPVGRRGAAGAHYQVLRQEEDCPARYPRRVGIPAKRPLF